MIDYEKFPEPRQLTATWTVDDIESERWTFGISPKWKWSFLWNWKALRRWLVNKKVEKFLIDAMADAIRKELDAAMIE